MRQEGRHLVQGHHGLSKRVVSSGPLLGQNAADTWKTHSNEKPRRRMTGPTLGRALPESVSKEGRRVSTKASGKRRNLTQGRADDETSSDRSFDGDPESMKDLVSETLVESSRRVLRRTLRCICKAKSGESVVGLS